MAAKYAVKLSLILGKLDLLDMGEFQEAAISNHTHHPFSRIALLSVSRIVALYVHTCFTNFQNPTWIQSPICMSAHVYVLTTGERHARKASLQETWPISYASSHTSHVNKVELIIRKVPR